MMWAEFVRYQVDVRRSSVWSSLMGSIDLVRNEIKYLFSWRSLQDLTWDKWKCPLFILFSKQLITQRGWAFQYKYATLPILEFRKDCDRLKYLIKIPVLEKMVLLKWHPTCVISNCSMSLTGRFSHIIIAIIWGLMCQKQVSSTGTRDYIPQYLWDVFFPCPWYLNLLAHKSSYESHPIAIPIYIARHVLGAPWQVVDASVFIYYLHISINYVVQLIAAAI